MPLEARAAALAAQGGRPAVVVETYRADLPALLAGAALSVSQAGYNTLMDILQACARAVVVPRTRFSPVKSTSDLLVLRDGQPIFTRALDTHGQERCFGNAILAANGKALWATFRQAKGTNAMAYGLMKIPFSDAPPRELRLITDAPEEDELAMYYFQLSISHDGKTAALASSYLACTEKEFKPADCALFLVDVSDPKWKVTKVPITMPDRRRDLMH